MSLTLDTPSDSIPIATNEAFRNYWLPGARALDLQLVREFGSLTITPSNLNQLIEELSRLREWFLKNYADELGQHLVGRVNLMLAALEPLKLMEHFTASTG